MFERATHRINLSIIDLKTEVVHSLAAQTTSYRFENTPVYGCSHPVNQTATMGSKKVHFLFAFLNQSIIIIIVCDVFGSAFRNISTQKASFMTDDVCES